MNEPTIILLYIDPGAAGFIIVTVLGFMAAIGYTARAYFYRIKQQIFGKGRPPTTRRPSRRRNAKR